MSLHLVLLPQGYRTTGAVFEETTGVDSWITADSPEKEPLTGLATGDYPASVSEHGFVDFSSLYAIVLS